MAQHSVTAPVSFPLGGPTPARAPGLSDSPWAPALTGGCAALAMVLGLLVWASLMSVAGGTVATGQVSVEGNRKAVQHRDGGSVRAVLVQDGQRVTKGQPLVELDTSELQADVTVLKSARFQNLARLARLKAEAANAKQITWPVLLANATTDAVQIRGIITQEESLFSARWASYQGNIGLLTAQIEGRRKTIESHRGKIAALRAQVLSVEDELNSLAPLAAKGFVARPRITTLERSASALKGEMENTQALASTEQTAIAQAEGQIVQMEKDRREAIARDISDTEARLADTEPKLASAQEKLGRAVLTAPEAGYVYSLTVFNAGAAIVPGQTVLEIVPDAEALVLAVDIHPTDVERVRPGQGVSIHLLPYKQRYQAIIRGRLEKVSADSMQDKQDKTKTFYRGVVRADPADLKRSGAELVPGMPAQVVIETESRTILAYFLDPIYRIYDFALREK